MITGTNADCNISSIKITETTATISLLIFAIKSTDTPIALKAYLKDYDTGEETLLSNKAYWIDNHYYYNSNVLNSNTNVNTNKYKEIILNIDITNNNEASIKENRWVRSCYILLKNSETNKIVWTSEIIDLISDEFEIPTIKDVYFTSKQATTDSLTGLTKYKIQSNFTLSYRSERDFNYNNKNFEAYLQVKAPYTSLILETKKVSNLDGLSLTNYITTDNYYTEGEPYQIELIIANKNGDIFNTYTYSYKPYRKETCFWIKTNSGCKRVNAIYIVEED